MKDHSFAELCYFSHLEFALKVKFWDSFSSKNSTNFGYLDTPAVHNIQFGGAIFFQNQSNNLEFFNNHFAGANASQLPLHPRSLTASLPLKSDRDPRGKDRRPVPSFFRGKLANFGGVPFGSFGYLFPIPSQHQLWPKDDEIVMKSDTALPWFEATPGRSGISLR